MDRFTFNETGRGSKKEDIEWIRIWCENTNDSLLRVALIGDSITEQTYETVKKELQGIALVDYLATSYSILSPTYKGMVECFLNDSKYAVVYYNYGLHAFDVSGDDYEKEYREMLKRFLACANVVIGLTTTVQERTDLESESKEWTPVVKERNLRAVKLAKEFEIPVDDLYAISLQLGKNGKEIDGVHFNEIGIEQIGKSKAKIIKSILDELN